MLGQEENDPLCKIGPSTLMGGFFRQYWLPAVRADELPSPDCPPLRVKLLGEELIAFRVTSGEVGLLHNACPHRGASMFFGRNEEEGLRCVYHGWKCDVNGVCVDMPSEPAQGVHEPELYRQRSGEVILPKAVDWWDATQILRERYQAGDLDVLARLNP